MSKPSRISVDCTTGEITSIEYTDEEYAQYLIDMEAFAAKLAEEKQAQLNATETPSE